MSFDFSGFVLRPPRTSPTNAPTAGEVRNGVVREIRPVPPAYTLTASTPGAGEQPSLVVARADQYRAAVLEGASTSTTEYMTWAENSSQLGLVDDPSWWQDQGEGDIPLGSLTVVDSTPVPIPTGQPTPAGYGTFTDGTLTALVADTGARSISQIQALVIRRGDVDDYVDGGWVDEEDPAQGRLGTHPYEILLPTASEQDGTAGIARVTDTNILSGDLVTTGITAVLDGGLSVARGDQIVNVRYFVAPARFWWTRNDKDETRFGWNERTQKWEPFKGSAPVNLGDLAFDTTYQLFPPLHGYPVGSFLPGNEATPDAYAMLRLGNSPGATSTPVAAGTFRGIRVKFDNELEGGFDFTTDPNLAGVVGVTSGELQFNPDYVDQNAGSTIWYVYQGFSEVATGVVGDMLGAQDNPLFLSPIPTITEHPFLSFDTRRYLSVTLVDTEAALEAILPGSGEVVVAVSTGRLRFNTLDILRADPAEPSFDKEYLGGQVIYGGVALNLVPQPTRKPVALVDDAGTPVLVGPDNALFVPDGVLLPEEFADPADIYRGLGVSGILDTPDGTGALPLLPGTPASVRPGGDATADPSTGRIRVVGDEVGDTILFGRRTQITNLVVVDREADLPPFPFKIRASTAYIARALTSSGAGSKVVLSRKDRSRLNGGYAYFLQATLTPATYTTTAQLLSRGRGFFTLADGDLLTFAIDGTVYQWLADPLIAALPGRNLFTAQEVADSIDAVITGTGSASVLGGQIALQAGDLDTGSVEIGFGHDGEKDLTGCAALGFLPGWRAVGGVVNWLPDAGVAVGLHRNPTNRDRSAASADYRATDRLSDTILVDGVQPVPFVFLDNVPLQDVAGYAEGVFFQITTTIQQGNDVQIVVRPLHNYAEIQNRFGDKKFAWLESQALVRMLEQPVNVLDLGQTSVVPVSMLGAPGIGGGLSVAETGGGFVFLEQGVDYLLPNDGVTGTAVLTDRVGKRVAFASRGGFVADSSTFTDLSYTFNSGAPLIDVGYRLKLTSGGDGVEGSYRITAVGTNSLTVTPPFRASSERAVPWEIYEGLPASEVDPAIVADVVYKGFSHLPSEPFIVSVLTSVGTVPVSLSEQVDSPRRANMTEAMERGREISIRYGLAHPTSNGSNVGPLIPLQQVYLGVLANGALTVPDTGSTRFASTSFSILVGADRFQPVAVSTFSSDPGSGAGIEVLTAPAMEGGLLAPAGRLKFGSEILADYASAEVNYSEDFQVPADIPGLSVEYDPTDGTLVFSAAALLAYGLTGTLAFFVEQMVLEDKRDISVSPVLGSFGFQTPVQTGQVVEATYYKADIEGKRIGEPVTEFLSVAITDEVATRVDGNHYSFNTSSTRFIDTDVEPIVRAGVIQQNFGSVEDFTVSYPTGSVGLGLMTFARAMPSATVVKVSYRAFDATGGERTYDASTAPLYRPPFLIDARTTVVGVRGDRTGSWVPGQMLRVGGTCLYVKKVTYYPLRFDPGPPLIPFGPPTLIPAGDVTSLVFYPRTLQEVGSRSPANDLAALITDRPIALVVDPDSDVPVVPADSPAGFWQDLDLAAHPFEPVNSNQNTILFLGQVPYAVPGHVIEIGGHPFTIEQAETTEDGSRTRFVLSSMFTRGFSVDSSPTVRISVRPIYPPDTRGFLSVGGVLRDQDYELVLWGETDSSGELPGRTLREGIDYVLDFDNGLIRLLEPRQSPLGNQQQLTLDYTRLRVLAPAMVGGMVLLPRFLARYLYNVAPSAENGLLGAVVTARYTFRNPDTYYFRIVPQAVFMGEVAEGALRDITSRLPAGGSLLSTPRPTENWQRGRLSLQSERRSLLDTDRASRVFLDFYNQSIVAFEQILETINGGLIGDRDGKFRFYVGRGLEFAPPGYEDEITGYLNPRNLWADVFDATNPNTSIHALTSDTVVQPELATLVNGLMEGPFIDADTLWRLVESQLRLIANDIDDTLLIRLGKAHTFWTSTGNLRLLAKGLFARMVDSHRFSRLFPTETKAFFTTYPGLNADEDKGWTGTYNYSKHLKGTDRDGSTYRKTIGQFANPAIGEIENVRDATIYRRRARARIWAYSPTGFPELDTAITLAGGVTFTALPRPAILATPLQLRDFPLDPETGTVDFVQFLSQGGDLYDLETGDLDLATPPWLPGDQVSWGFPNGDVRSAFVAGEVDIFGVPSLTGAYIAEVLLGCVLTFQDGSVPPVLITDPTQLLVGTSPTSGEQAVFVLGQGDTIFAIPATGATTAPAADPPDSATMAQVSAAMDTYRPGFDVGLRSDGRIVDLSLPSRHDPSFLPLKEWMGQTSPPAMSAMEADVDFLYSGQNPLEIPALQGLERDDDGDFQIPYARSYNTELDRFGQASAGLARVMEALDPAGNYVYPDEVLGTDGSIIVAYAPVGTEYQEPSELFTDRDVQPVVNGSTALGIGDLSRYDLLLMEVTSPGDPDQGYRGILSVGDVRTADIGGGDFASFVEPPRFVTQTTPRTLKSAPTGSPIRYTFDNYFAFTNDPTYPADPQAPPFLAGVVVTSDTGTGTTTLDFSGIGQVALNDNLTTGLGNLNDLWSAAGAKALNKIRIDLIARTDPGVTTGPAGPAPLPAPGEIAYSIVIQGLTVTATDYLGNTASAAITGVTFGTGVAVSPADNKEISITAAAAWFDFVGVGAAAQAAWYLPHTEAVGVKTSIYGWEVALSVDTWNVFPLSAGKGESDTGWLDEDRLSFHEVIDLRRVKERGYLHPVSGTLDLSGKLVVHEVTIADPAGAGGIASTCTRDNNGLALGTPEPFTFLQRSITTTAVGYQPADAGGAWTPADVGDVPETGTIKVMGWEGYLNAPIASTNLTFSAVPSSIGMEGALSICGGTGLTASKNNTTLDAALGRVSNYDDRLTGITVGTGAVSNVVAGDILVVKQSDDAAHLATTKAGTYLVRQVVEGAGPGDLFLALDLAATAGSGSGWSAFTFPTFKSYSSGINRLDVTHLLPFDEAPLVGGQPTGFLTSGRVFIIRDINGLNSIDLTTYREAVISVDYASLDVTPGLEAFNTTDGTWLYADGTAIATEAEFERLLTTDEPADGFKISGMAWLPIQMGGGSSLLPDDNVVGWDVNSTASIHGFAFLTLLPTSTLTFGGATTFNAFAGGIKRVTGTADTVTVEEGTVVPSTSITPLETSIVYPNVPSRLYLGDFAAPTWTTLQGGGLGAAPECLLPGTILGTNDGAGTPAFKAQAGIFLEPSMPTPVFDLTPAGGAHVVDADHSLLSTAQGMRNLETLIGTDAAGAPLAVPVVPEMVTFEVRRIRRFHDVLDFVGENLAPLRFAYEIRRGRITTYTSNVGGKQTGLVEANNFTLDFNTSFPAAPHAPDVWNTGASHQGTNLGLFTDPNVNINVGDLFRVLDENGDVIDEVKIARVTDGTSLVLHAPGLTALPPGDYIASGGLRFEVYLRQPVVPHEQSNEQLLNLVTFREVTRTFADYTLETGGYVPEIATGELYEDVANNLYDDSTADTFTARGVRVGDIVILDPSGTVPQDGGLPLIPEAGSRPFGDEGVLERAPAVGVTGKDVYLAGGPDALDDNRGFYRVLDVVDDPVPHLVVSGASTYTGTQLADVAFPEVGGLTLDTLGYAIYPTIHDSALNSADYVDTGAPDGREGQMDLRPTRKRDATTRSFSTYSDPVGDPGEAYSLRPFSYRVIRPSSLFTTEAQDLVLMHRERILSLIEALSGASTGRKHGNYWIFQRDNHLHDLGNTTNPLSGLGVLSNLLIESLVGRMDVAPFANTSDALSILDRRFWVLDRQLDLLTAKDNVSARKAGFGDTPYTAYADAVGGGDAVRPVLPDRVGVVLDVEDRLRQFRYTWLAYRTHRILGTLAALKRFDDQLPEREAEQVRLLQILANTLG